MQCYLLTLRVVKHKTCRFSRRAKNWTLVEMFMVILRRHGMALELNVQTRLEHARTNLCKIYEWNSATTHLGLQTLGRTVTSKWGCSAYQELRNQAYLEDQAKQGCSRTLRPHGMQVHCCCKHLPSSVRQSVCLMGKKRFEHENSGVVFVVSRQRNLSY